MKYFSKMVNCVNRNSISFTLLLSVFMLFKPISNKADNPEWMYIMDNKFLTAMVDDGEYVWIAVASANIYKYDKSNQTIIDSIPGGYFSNVQDMEFDKKGNLWIAAGLIYKYTGDTLIYYSEEITGHSGSISYVEVEQNGKVWFGGDEGVASYEDNKWTIFNAENSALPYNDITGTTFIWSMDIDLNDKLWVSIPRGGIAQYDGINWNVYNKTNSGLPTDLVGNIKFDKTGNLWLTTYQDGLMKFDGEKWIIYDSTNSSLPFNQAGKIAVDSFNNLWIGSSSYYPGGLIKFDGDNWTIYNTENSNIQANFVNEIIIDKYNNKLLAVVSDERIGLNIFREGGVVFTSVIDNLIISDDLILSPNPASEFIEIPKDEFLGCNFKIFNILGKNILNGIITDNTININSLITGTYFLQITGVKNLYYSKFIKN